MYRQIYHWLNAVVVFLLVSVFSANYSNAAPYAALVMDARTGQVLHARNADTRLHPASLTKMMTLYVVFQAVERGQISLNTRVKISKNAANEEPSKLGLKAGQRIELKYLIRGAAVKSANDAATALAEAISGSEAAFARRMTATARRLGMKKSTFKNAHGLTASGHLSTARDMTLLGRRLFYDYPQYYNLFSRRSTDAKVRKVANTNRKLLASYRGADGIKTGYTRAAGFNLVASAERGNKRIIATVFGGKTSSSRNARVAQLLDMGFGRVNPRLAERKPKKVAPVAVKKKSKSIKVAVSGSVRKSPIPKLRTRVIAAPVKMAAAEIADIETAIVEAVKVEKTIRSPQTSIKPELRPASLLKVTKADTLKKPKVRKIQATESNVTANVKPAKKVEPKIETVKVVTRQSVIGKSWAVQLGAFGSKYEAEKMLLKTSLSNLGPLDGAQRRISPATINGSRLYRARFVGLTQSDANKTCSRLRARSQTCLTLSPGS